MDWLGVFRKQQKAAKRRGFEGAAGSRLFNDFLASSRSADGELRYSLKTLRERARELNRNNDYAKRFVQLLLTNVIGPDGIGLQNRARDDSFALDQVANNAIESRWRDWCRQGVCTVDGRMTWVDAQRLFMETMARDGEVLVRLVRGWAGNEYGFAIQFVEADLLNEENNAERKDGSAIRMGVETDIYGKPIAYHMATKHPGDDPQGFTPSGSERVDARDMLHIFKIERAGQSRGIPPLAVAMTDLQMLGKYLEAELVASRIAASKMGFYTSAAEYAGDDTEDTHNPVAEIAPGSFEKLEPGMAFTSFDPQHPTSQFEMFVKQTLRAISSGLGVSYISLANDLEGVNYSSIRQGALDERDHYRTMQRFTIDHFCAPIYRAWLEMALFSDTLTLPSAKFEKFHRPVWRPRGWQWVDPLKETNALVVQMQNGISTYQDALGHYGRDVEEQFEQLERERELAASKGIELAFQPFGGSRNEDIEDGRPDD